MKDAHAWERMLETLANARARLGRCVLVALTLAAPGCASTWKAPVALVRAESENLARPHADLMTRVATAESKRAELIQLTTHIQLTAGDEAPRTLPALTESERARARREGVQQPLLPWLGSRTSENSSNSKSSGKSSKSSASSSQAKSAGGPRVYTERGPETDRPAPIPPMPGPLPAAPVPQAFRANPAPRAPETTAPTPPAAKPVARIPDSAPANKPAAKSATETPAPSVPATIASAAAVRPTVVSASRARQQAAADWAKDRQSLSANTASQAKPAEATPEAAPEAAADLPEPKLVRKDPQPRGESKSEGNRPPTVATNEAGPADPELKSAPSNIPPAPLAATGSRAPQIKALPKVRPATEADPAPAPLANNDDIAPTPIGEAEERATPVEHDNRLAVNDRVGHGRFPGGIPRPQLVQPIAGASAHWKSEMSEDALAHLKAAQDEELAVAPLPGERLNLDSKPESKAASSQAVAEPKREAKAETKPQGDAGDLAQDDPPPAPPAALFDAPAFPTKSEPLAARPQETLRIRLTPDAPAPTHPPRHEVVPPVADPPATRPVQDASAEYLRFADRHATRPNATPKSSRPAEFVSSLAAARQAEMAAAVQRAPREEALASNETFANRPRSEAAPARSEIRPEPTRDETPRVRVESPSTSTEADSARRKPVSEVPRVASNAKPRDTIGDSVVKSRNADSSPKDELAPTAPIPSAADGAPALNVERLATSTEPQQADKNSAYVRAIADWAAESYAGVRNYRMDLFQVNAAPGPLAHRDGVCFRFRKAPLAIHVGWGSDPHQGRQWLFAEGQHEDKWYVLEPVASGRMKVLVEPNALPLGNGTRPIQEWGLGGVIARFEKHLAMASEGQGRCVYAGVVRRQEIDVTLHEVAYFPPGNGCSVHYYFATSNLLPRMVEMKMDGDVRSAEIFKKLELNDKALDRPGSFDANELFRN